MLKSLKSSQVSVVALFLSYQHRITLEHYSHSSESDRYDSDCDTVFVLKAAKEIFWLLFDDRVVSMPAAGGGAQNSSKEALSFFFYRSYSNFICYVFYLLFIYFLISKVDNKP